MLTLKEWVKQNSIADEMYFKKLAVSQVEKFQKLADELKAPIYVAGTHMSKSITLPVVKIIGKHGHFIIRDNFYDYNLAVEWEFPINIPLEDVYPIFDWEWYLEEMKKKEKYCHWDKWTEEELNDPRITRIEVKSTSGNTYWHEVDFEEKDRWLNRFTDTSWFTEDWSSGKLIVEGELGPDCKLYKASYPYAQGINVNHGYYEYGVTEFLIAVNEVSDIVKKINNLPKI